MSTNIEQVRDTLERVSAAACILAHFARRDGRYDLLRRARHIGTTLDACQRALRSEEDSDPTVAVAFASSAYRMLNQIERELWSNPADRPHSDTIAECLDRLGISLLPWQLHFLRRYFA